VGRRSSPRFNRGRIATAGGVPAPPDVTAPTLVGNPTIDVAGTKLTSTYSEALDTGSVPAAATCSLAGTAETVTAIAVVGSTVVHTLSGVVAEGAVVTLTYTAGASPIRDAAGNNAANLVNQAVTNNAIETPLLRHAAGVLWLRGDLGNVPGTWTDQSGNGHNFTQATGAKQAAIEAAGYAGQPDALFDGTDDVLVNTTLAATLPGGTDTPFSLYVAVQFVTAPAATGVVFGAGRAASSTTFLDLFWSSTSGINGTGGSWRVTRRDNASLLKTAIGPIALKCLTLLELHYNGTTLVLVVNGVESASLDLDVGLSTLDRLALGALVQNIAAGSLFGNCRIAEVFIASAVSSAGEKTDMRDYFYTLYPGIGVTDHQFQVGGDAGYVAGLDPNTRRFWRFGGDDTDRDLIQWVNIDTWISGQSATTIPASGGYAVWHPGIAKFIIYGGRVGAAWPGVTTIWTFDPVTEVRTTLAETLPVGLAAASAVLHPASGKVYIFGGVATGPTDTKNTIYVHDPGAGTVTNTTAVLPAANSNIGAVWADDVAKVFLIGGYDGSISLDVILTYDPATPAVNPVNTGQVLSTELENEHGAYFDGRIYCFGGYRRQNSTYYDIIHRINTSPVAVSVLAETIYRADDDAIAFADSVTGKVFAGPYIHSSQVTDNHGPDKRIMVELDPVTETLAPEPALL
jgi:hypothetical protein